MSSGLTFVKVENQPLSMELDTGSAVSILPYDMFLERFSDLKTYTGEQIVPVALVAFLCKLNI